MVSKSVKLGFSLYGFHSLEHNQRLIRQFSQAGFQFVFMSLNLEAKQEALSLQRLIADCHTHQLEVLADINATTYQQYGLEGLQALGLQALRLDDGFSLSDVQRLAPHFRLVLNGSTLDFDFVQAIQSLPEAQQLVACHNYYPKPYTGLGIEAVRRLNQQWRALDIPTIAFISGEVRRLPLYEGLPTVEAHRQARPLLAALDLLVEGQTDWVCIGDTDVSPGSLADLNALAQGIIPIRAQLPEYLYGQSWTNRLDASDYVIRAIESRARLQRQIFESRAIERSTGDVVIANQDFGRYAGELEICLRSLPADTRQDVVGQVVTDDLALLPYLRAPYAFCFTRPHF